MRLFELHPTGDRPRLTFHPRVTVIRGLDDDAVQELKSLLRALAAGTTLGCEGTIEVHGILVPLESAARLVGPAVGEPVIARIEEVLPPVPGPPGGDPNDPVIGTHARAVAAREALESAVNDLTEQLAAAAGTREGLNERLSAAVARIDRDAAFVLDRADAELRTAARTADLDPYVTLADPVARVAQLNEVIAECDQILPDLPAGNRATLAAATATLRAALATGEVVAPEAEALAEAWLSLHRRLDGIESRLETAGGETEAVAARVEAAREAAERARVASTPREVTAEEEQRLADLHNQLVKLEGRATTGVRRGSARKQLDEVHAELQRELEALGYPTFMAYRMGNGLSTVDPSRREEHQEAVAELEEAEAEWAVLMARLQNDDELNDVLVAIEQVSARAAELLGTEPEELEAETPEGLAGRLREIHVEAESLGVDPQDAAEHLHSVLEATGATDHRDVTATEAVLALGESWLEVLRAADDAAVRVLRDRERAESELAAINQISPRAGADLLDAVRSAAWQAEAEVSELRRGLSSLAVLRRELYELAASELAAAENHDAKLELLEAARVMEDQAEARLPSNRRLATARKGITALVPRGLGGPVPMIVELGDVDDGSLEQLVAVPDDVQVIALGGGSGVVEWVDTLGPTHASLVEVGASV